MTTTGCPMRLLFTALPGEELGLELLLLLGLAALELLALLLSRALLLSLALPEALAERWVVLLPLELPL